MDMISLSLGGKSLIYSISHTFMQERRFSCSYYQAHTKRATIYFEILIIVLNMTLWFQIGELSLDVIIPPANCVCGRVYCFHVVRPSERPTVRMCVRNVLFP